MTPIEIEHFIDIENPIKFTTPKKRKIERVLLNDSLIMNFFMLLIKHYNILMFYCKKAK